MLHVGSEITWFLGHLCFGSTRLAPHSSTHRIWIKQTTSSFNNNLGWNVRELELGVGRSKTMWNNDGSDFRSQKGFGGSYSRCWNITLSFHHSNVNDLRVVCDVCSETLKEPLRIDLDRFFPDSQRVRLKLQTAFILKSFEWIWATSSDLQKEWPNTSASNFAKLRLWFDWKKDMNFMNWIYPPPRILVAKWRT